MKLSINLQKRWTGFRIVNIGSGPIFDVAGFHGGNAVELWIGDYGMMDVVEPMLIGHLSPLEAHNLALLLEQAALAAKGAFQSKGSNANGEQQDQIGQSDWPV